MGINKGETGFAFEMDCDFNASGYSGATIYILRPGGTLLTKTATAVTDGSDGRFQYTVGAGDFTEKGEYIAQLKVDMGGNKVLFSDMETFRVGGSLV